ncbi:hypothetical protein GCM10007111_43920 [Virgibacillus kapii]|uniref:Uncharacterized protein n=1 Tax=Virgibacillus kapii TaxID=1638645 RepID=A0ABQ2E2B4_9BACI|nr:hypothetical protein GCM10007111_43920 [Virgibacillus kapii]
MILFAEILRTIFIVIAIISSALYLRHLEKTKKQSKLSTVEFTMYISIQFAYTLFAISLLIFVFVD